MSIMHSINNIKMYCINNHINWFSMMAIRKYND